MTNVEEKESEILVAVDGADESTNALSWCLKNIIIAPNSKHTIVLLYIKPPRIFYNAFDGTRYLFSSDIIETMDKYNHDVAESVMDKAKRLCREYGVCTYMHSLCPRKFVSMIVEVKTMVGQGDPREVICEMADKIQPELLVMGSHGYGLIKRALLGSVSNHCALNAKCPVLIVKRPKH